MNQTQDLFISHASKDKAEYILPLAKALSSKGVSYWLDAFEIGWGQSFVAAINEGLRTSQKLLLCLSRHFLERPWARAEMESALAQQVESDQTRVLPLILNSRDEVLSAYPLLRSLSYRLFDQGVESIAVELADLFGVERAKNKGGLHVRIKSAHSGLLCDIVESPGVSVEWLADKARAALGGKERADLGIFKPLPIRWILVDVEAEEHWRQLTESSQRELYALVKVGDEFRSATSGTTSLEKLGVQDGTVFHLYAIGLNHVMMMRPLSKIRGGPFTV